jgi:hypothetical protein
MTDKKHEIAVYAGAKTAELIQADEPVTARNAPTIVKAAGKGAEFAWEEFFAGELPNAHTRKNYMHAVQQFLDWVEGWLGLSRKPPSHRLSRATVRQILASWPICLSE